MGPNANQSIFLLVPMGRARVICLWGGRVFCCFAVPVGWAAEKKGALLLSTTFRFRSGGLSLAAAAPQTSLPPILGRFLSQTFLLSQTFRRILGGFRPPRSMDLQS